jgi:hypothetical protein
MDTMTEEVVATETHAVTMADTESDTIALLQIDVSVTEILDIMGI